MAYYDFLARYILIADEGWREVVLGRTGDMMRFEAESLARRMGKSLKLPVRAVRADD